MDKTRRARAHVLAVCLAALLPFYLVAFEAFQPSSLPALQPSSSPSFRSGASELVVLPVVVTDKQGRYISDLERERFTVFDNGRRVPIEIFTNQDTPLTVGLIIDASGSMRPKISEVILASLAFARSSNPEDELFVVRFNDDVQ